MSAKPHMCNYSGCHKTFTRKDNLQRHIREVHGPPTFQCSIPDCEQMFKRKADLKIHIRDTHSGTTSYQCNYPECSKSYKHRSSLQKHIREVHNSTIYQCPIPGCNKTFIWKDSLLDHLKFVHNFDESKRLPCPIPSCEQSFKRKKDLKTHIRYMHSKTPLHKCPNPDCNKTYRRKSSLNEHIRFFHQDYRPHVCEKCGQPFRQVHLLRYHIENKLCWQPPIGEIRAEYVAKHHYAVNNLEQFLRETKNPKTIDNEVVLPNERRLDLLVKCPDNRIVGFDVTISQSEAISLRKGITKKYKRNYEKFCDIVYIVVISNVKNTLKTIQECNRNPTKPKEVRVVHWRAIVRDSPKYIKIFQQIEDESVL
ncbi:MAG: C2H2-type zinc finger protein [Candidatus Heimdallarchaeota archaeon]